MNTGTGNGTRSGHGLTRRISAEQVRTATFGRTSLVRRGLSEDEVSGFLHRVAEEFGGLETELANARAENVRLKSALRDWQSQHGDSRGGDQRGGDPRGGDPHGADRRGADVRAPGRPAAAALPVEAVNLLSRAQRQIEAQVAETERYCRLREQEAQQRYDQIVYGARQHAQEEAERVARAYRATAGPRYSPEGERAERTGAWLNAVLQSLDALAAHVDATRHAFSVEVGKLAEPSGGGWVQADEPITRSPMITENGAAHIP